MHILLYVLRYYYTIVKTAYSKSEPLFVAIIVQFFIKLFTHWCIYVHTCMTMIIIVLEINII